MVVRRFREHVAAHNWFAVGIDLGIVVLGVFLGLQANNWNEARNARAATAAYREQIIENLRANEADIGARLHYYRQVQAHSIAALRTLETPGAAIGTDFLISAYQASQVWQRPLHRSAYDEMLAAGLGGSLGGAETRTSLTGFYAQMPQFNDLALSTTPYRDVIRGVIPYPIQRQMRERCGDITRRLPGGVVSARLPDHCAAEFDRASIARAQGHLGALSGLETDLTRHIADLDQKLGGFGAFQRRARELRLHLESLDRGQSPAVP